MSGMIEKLADVAREEFHSDPERGLSETYEAMVRAVLAVLREPSEELCEAGGYEVRNYEPGGFAGSGEEWAGKTFTAMIDAILTEG